MKNKLRDDRGRPIRLKNNKYKIVTREKQDFIPSQFVAVFDIKFNVGSLKRPNFIKKTITGYLDMSYSLGNFDNEMLVSIAYEKAIKKFIATTGFQTGSKDIRNRVKDVILKDTFWISYTDYATLLNHKISNIK